MKKTPLNLIAGLIYAPLMGLILVLFHPINMLTTYMGYRMQMRAIHAMMWSLMNSLLILGIRFKVEGKELLDRLPDDRPLILVSNHQSVFDIPAIGWVFRKKHHPKFISKKSLMYNIPSVSWHLRHGKHVCIDRKDKEGALKAIKAFAEVIRREKLAACIFAEGTRARDGKLKPFKTAGFEQLVTCMPEAVVVPIALENFWKLTYHKLLYMPIGITVRLHLLGKYEIGDFESPQALLRRCEEDIRRCLGQPAAA
ncbi:lysophospholipid acyltransferase family protein [Thermonema rossianum]|uniref:lysophospholipid acyltransferase family protein n=1 Tax=Thermonema rossianum TaxID=55505 RepID=UPI00057055DC|nr:lysophospholipid acyltransferase family protein [Thermonema rossianum]